VIAQVMRVPNHLGDLIMALPAIESLGPCDLLVPVGLAPLLEMTFPKESVIAFQRGVAGFRGATAALRERSYARGVLLPPSFSSALLFAAGGVTERRGLATDSRRALLTDPVPLHETKGLHRTDVYLLLATGERPHETPVPRLSVPAHQRERWRSFFGAPEDRVIGLFPGSNASSRRWDAERFRELAQRLAAEGARVIVFAGPAETELSCFVAGTVAFDAGGRTDLPLLAAALEACDILVTNDSGPMHLAAAVGTVTVSLMGAANPAVTGLFGQQHRVLRHTELPCVPCVKNTCPRSGPGYVLPTAERECLRLIEVSDVLAEVAPPT
jgi:heptosyltransferase-2